MRSHQTLTEDGHPQLGLEAVTNPVARPSLLRGLPSGEHPGLPLSYPGHRLVWSQRHASRMSRTTKELAAPADLWTTLRSSGPVDSKTQATLGASSHKIASRA